MEAYFGQALNVVLTNLTGIQIAGVSYSSIKERIHRLEIFPDAIKGKARLFSIEKAQAIISQIKYQKRTYYQIFESKLNYDN